jgi:tRNA-Thr(GGU) m(6)t(6)A37 methyltransferase TsaA
MKIEFKPIGIIRSSYKSKHQAPSQGWFKPELISEIEIFKEHEAGLKDIEGFSHLVILYYFHKSEGYTYQVKTPWDKELHGLFATRTPNRLNGIGFSVIELLEKKGNILKVKGLDAIDDTPLLDIKPYVPIIDTKNDIKIGWLEDKIKNEVKK